MTTSTLSETRTTYNVIADAPVGDPDHTVVVGAHLDSVAAGPGINDDGSGTSQDLEIARSSRKAVKNPRNHVRFLLVGAEEEGLLGSAHYVVELTQDEQTKIIAMLDFDMVASPNYAGRSMTATAPSPGDPGPAGSGIIERSVRLLGRSRPGDEPIAVRRTVRLRRVHRRRNPGGRHLRRCRGDQDRGAGAVRRHGRLAFDPCYHQACDTSTT